MENFIVSARKYRPDRFDQVVGQNAITSTLKNAIKNSHLAHAYLFCGPRGVGKTTCARILAKTVNCNNLGEDVEACNECESCKAFNSSRSYNIHELDAASNNSVDDIRNLTDQVRVPPQIGKYSVYIIDEVHMLSQQAFNAFLKTLEEPPAHAIFILATTEKHKIIPTILSRCQIYDFQRIKVRDIAEYLEKIAKQEKLETEPEALQVIAQKAAGALRDALSIFDQIVSYTGSKISYTDVLENLNILDYDYYFNMTGACLAGDPSKALLLFDDVITRGFDGQNFINGLSAHFRDLLVSQDEETIELLEVGAGIRKKYLEQSQQCPADFLLNALDILNQADMNYRSSKNQRLLIELALSRCCTLAHSKKKELRPEEPVAEKEKEPSTEPSGKEISPDPVNEKQSPEPKKETEPESETEEKHLTETPAPLVSIREAISGKRAESSANEEDPESGAEKPDQKGALKKQEFSPETMAHFWLEFAESIKSDRPRMASTLKNHMPRKIDNIRYKVLLDNSTQKDQFNREIKPELIDYLRDRLQNDQLELQLDVIPQEENREMLYTQEDKFKHMSEKNPALRKLKQKFNLDFD